jgi:hypothetical protein
MAQTLFHPAAPDGAAPESLVGASAWGAPWRALKRLDGALHRRRVLAAHQRVAGRRDLLLHWLDGVDAGTFARNGFLLKRGLLPDEGFQTLRRQLKAHLSPSSTRVVVNAGLRRAVPALGLLLDDRPWNGLTRYVAGVDRSPAVRIEVGAADEANPPEGERDLQTLLHSDAWWPRMKAWYFLTDVDHDDAPLCYVPGSHRLTPARLRWEQARGRRGVDRVDKDELAAMGLGKPARLVVPANTLIVVDAFGFHKRARPRQPGLRLEVQAGQ